MTPPPSIWVDFENGPQVSALAPIIEHFRARGVEALITARDFNFTLELCESQGYDFEVLGRSSSGGTAAKVVRVLERTMMLQRKVRRHAPRVVLALSHGSRSQILAARSLGIPRVSLIDYEFVNQFSLRFVDHLLVPHPIPAHAWGRYAAKATHYPGLKEELYLHGFEPDAESIPELPADRVRVLFRPEGRFAHYRAPATARIEAALVQAFADHPEIFVVLMPRDPAQGQQIAQHLSATGVDYWMPERVLDGPNLLWQMDLVLSGGGTMAREAAVLGIPSYSFFAGRIGAVDRYLERDGRLRRLAQPEDVQRLAFEARPHAEPNVSGEALQFVTQFLDEFVRTRSVAAA